MQETSNQALYRIAITPALHGTSDRRDSQMPDVAMSRIQQVRAPERSHPTRPLGLNFLRKK
jgi:hypothetical protein